MTPLEAIITIRDWYLSPDSDYPKREAERATAALRDLKAASRTAYDQVTEMAETCTFSTRHYGNGQFFTWASLPSGIDIGGDPWPAARYHGAALKMQCLFRIYESEMDRLGFREPAAV